MGILDSDLPSTITPAKTLPSNVADYLKQDRYITEGFKPYAVGFDVDRKGLIFNVSRVGPTTANVSTATVSPYSIFAESLADGDSGQSCFVIVDGNAVLLTNWENVAGGPSMANYRDDINTLIASVDAAEGVDTGYQLEEVDLTPFNFRKYRN